jgi:fumarate hydratase class II
MATRSESDSFGTVEVDAERYWGAQTERSRQNFRIGDERMPRDLIVALAMIKKAAARVHRELDELDERRCELIVAAADEIIAGQLDDEFPLRVWQTGSGTQTNMNVNEVICQPRDRAGRRRPAVSKEPVHPNDHVNWSQSSNDTFPDRDAHRRESCERARRGCVPAVTALRDTLQDRASQLR